MPRTGYCLGERAFGILIANQKGVKMQLMLLGAVFAQMLVRPWSQTNVPLADRVAADFKDTPPGAAFVHYDVPPMSGFQRLPDLYPEDGTPGGTVRVVMAKDEYEPGSFLIWGLRDLGKVQLEVGEFKTDDGKVFPKKDLELKVVKCWFQNGNGWYSYFGDTGFKLCPELLLNDEDLIRVDPEKKANYARIDDGNGKSHEQWLNPPCQLGHSYWVWYEVEGFACMKPGFADADTLQPVTIPKGEFRNFFLTAHATKDTPAGVYRGEVKVKGDGERRMGSIPVEIKVLDFTLPQPMCYFDDTKPFYVSFYGNHEFNYLMQFNGGDYELAKRQMLAILKDRVAHNDNINWPRHTELFKGQGRDMLEIMKEAGCRQDVYVLNVPCSRIGATVSMDAFNSRSIAEQDRVLGHHNVYLFAGDEPPEWWLKATRPGLAQAQKAGFKFILAGFDSVFRQAGYLYDWHNVNREPQDDFTPKHWNQIGSQPHVAWYSRQHVGAENPEFNRRQNGMAAYLTGYSALCNFEHGFSGYNDGTPGYRPMVYAYGQAKGVLDTIQWEGFREGVDDIRYATMLVKLARAAAKSGDVDRRHAGNIALQYLASFRTDADDLDDCRFEMIRHILKLRGMESRK